MSKRNMKKSFKNIWLWLISTISFLCSVVALSRTFCRAELQFDYIGVVVAILSILITILIGWNIWNVIDMKTDIDKVKKQFEDFYSSIHKKQEELDKKITELDKKQENIKYFGYAITDFCQVYSKLEPAKKDYFKTYCKSLNALRNFIKTDEKLEWYANACIYNMSEALRMAKEKNEQCDAETEKNIKEYLDEVRKCQLNGFSKHFEKILELENERKKYGRRETNSEHF